MPYVEAGSGSDIFTTRLAEGLRSHGHIIETCPLPHFYQYSPWFLKFITPPVNTDLILTNSWNGFAFKKKIKLAVIAHHFVHDPIYKQYRSLPQTLFHEILVKNFERSSFKQADKIIAVSHYTKEKLHELFGDFDVSVIHNGIDFNLFKEGNKKRILKQRKIRLLFVGNLSKRKGSDLLPGILEKLGDGYELFYTCGLRTKDPFSGIASMKSLGRLDQVELIRAYQDADILLFPTRLEGFGLTAVEAMSCGTPVVASDCSSLPEIIENGENGILCPPNNIEAFADAVKELASQPKRLIEMGKKARKSVKLKFGFDTMINKYISFLLI